MPTVLIDYSNVKGAAKNAGDVANELEDYADVISKKILRKLDKVHGKDSAGYLAAARAAAEQKSSQLKIKAPVFSGFASRLKLFGTNVEAKDNDVSNRMEYLYDPFKPRWYELRAVASDIVYCVAIELGGDVLDNTKIGRFFRNQWRSDMNELSHWRDDVLNYFKHGDGQYIMNVADAAFDFLKVAALVAGCAVLVLSGGWMVFLAGAAMVVGSAALVYEFGNFAAVTEANFDAFDEARKGNKDLAHYYSQTEDITDYVEKRDFGGSKINSFIMDTADVVEDVGEISKKLVKGINTVGTVYSLGNITGLDGKTVVDHDFSWSNIKRNIERTLYEKGLENGVTWDYSPVDDLGSPDVDTSVGINFSKFLFGKELELRDDAGFTNGTKNPFKQIKAGVSIAEKTVDYFAKGEIPLERWEQVTDLEEKSGRLGTILGHDMQGKFILNDEYDLEFQLDIEAEAP